MKKFLLLGLSLVMVTVFTGCEWKSSGDSSSWNDSYSWINFSGLYRGVNGDLVGEFSSVTGQDDSDTTPVTVVNNEDGGTAPATQTSLSGTLNFRPGITPGSVSIFLEAANAGDSSGTATDNGSEVLSGSYNLVGIDPASALPITGTIDYGTGAWTLELPSPGLLTPCPIRINYTYSAATATEAVDAGDGLAVAGGDVNTMLIEQVGNKLRFIDSNGNSYQGSLSVVSLPGGDKTGDSSGTVSATYEVSGVAGGETVTISGSFSGAYTSAADTGTEGSFYGQMADRLLEGIWIQSSGTADVYGLAPDLSVDTQATTTTE